MLMSYLYYLLVTINYSLLNSFSAFSLPPPFHFLSPKIKIHLSIFLFLLLSLKVDRTAMSGAEEEWVRAAMSDDAMVVDLLVRLHHALPPPPPLLHERAPLPLRWTVRQRRSKSASANNNPKKPAHSHRGSPTTPLSWSGATSFSGRSEDSGRQPTPPKLFDSSRSKILVDSEKTNSKRSRKKKTLAELKNEEKLLLNERRDLKREMAILRLCMETQRATNENLKRIKVELQPCLDKQLESTFAAEESTSGQLQTEATAHQVPAVVASDIAQELLTSSAACLEAKTDAKFVLPDLNVPFDEPGCDVILQW